MKMNNIKILAAMLLSSLVISSVAIAQEVDKVPDCASGQSLTLRDNGWLTAANQNVASHHEILADYLQPGTPDTVWHNANNTGRQIGVCRVFNKLHYFVK
jgi:hypothetical protein